MTNKQLARIHTTLRVRLRLRQSDVAASAGIDRKRVWKLEAAQLDDLTVGELRRCFEALGARVDVAAFFQGAALDRILDELHAATLGAVVSTLRAEGWDVRIEVSYSIDGERGSIDALAWRADESSLLVVEVKSELPGVDPLLRLLDVKVRHASKIASRQFGWRAATVSRVVVFPEGRTVRRQVERHAQVFATALPNRSREVRAWIKQPTGVIAGLWFLTVAAPENIRRNPSSVKRVRRPRSRSEPSGRQVRLPASGPYATDIGLIDPHKVLRSRN